MKHHYYTDNGHAVREVGGTNPDRGTIVRGIFSSDQATGKVFSAEYAIWYKF